MSNPAKLARWRLLKTDIMKTKRKYKTRKPGPIHPKRLEFKRLFPAREWETVEMAKRLLVSPTTLNLWIKEDFPGEKFGPKAKPAVISPKRAEFRRLFPSQAWRVDELAGRLSVNGGTLTRWRAVDFPNQGFKRRSPKLNPKRIAFRRLYQSRAFTLQEIADRIKVPHRTATDWRKKDFPLGARWRWLEFVRLYEMDVYSRSELARALECRPESIDRFRMRYAEQWPELAKLRKRKKPKAEK
jgi:hypothetical protein